MNCPPAVGAAVGLEPHGGVVDQGVVGVAHGRPVDQVARLHDRKSGTHVHGRAAHVVGLADPDNGEVGDVGPNQGIVGTLRESGDGDCQGDEAQGGEAPGMAKQ